MTDTERIIRCIERHPGWTDKQVRNSLDIRIDTIRAVRMGLPAPLATDHPPASTRPGGIVSLSAIREKLDTRAAILREVAALPADQLIDERELRTRAAGTDANRFRRTVENNGDLFRAYRIKLRLDEGEPRWYWGQTETVAEAQGLRDL